MRCRPHLSFATTFTAAIHRHTPSWPPSLMLFFSMEATSIFCCLSTALLGLTARTLAPVVVGDGCGGIVAWDEVRHVFSDLEDTSSTTWAAFGWKMRQWGMHCLTVEELEPLLTAVALYRSASMTSPLSLSTSSSSMRLQGWW